MLTYLHERCGITNKFQRLVEAGIDPKSRDLRGYQAIHLAAILGDVAAIEKLVMLGADLHATTTDGATVFDLLRARDFAKVTSMPKELSTSQRTIPSPHRYLATNIYTQDTLLALWQQKRATTKIEAYAAFVEDALVKEYIAIQNGKAHVPPYRVRKIASTSASRHPLEGELEVYASRHLKAGEYIGEFTGPVEFAHPDHLKYAQQLAPGLNLNAEAAGSLIEFMNHGAPNCALILVAHKGLPRIILYTLCVVPEGGALFCSYNHDYFAGQNIPFFELNPGHIEEFVRRTRCLQFFANGIKMNKEKPGP